MADLTLSALPKTWIFDVDGTLVLHNGHLRPQGDELLPGVKNLFAQIPNQDKIVLITARKKTYRTQLETFLQANGIRFDTILYEMPMGERILVNDRKPSGLVTAYAVNKERDAPLDFNVIIDQSL